MARKFGFPNVAALEVGQSCVVEARVSEVKRKCAQYGARNGKRLAVSRWMDNALIAKVSRLPVTDAELPGAA